MKRFFFLTAGFLTGLTSLWADMAMPFVDTPVGKTAIGTAVLLVLSESGGATQYVVVAHGDCGEWHAYPATLDKDVSADGRMHSPVLLTAKVIAHETAAYKKALVITKIEPITPGKVERRTK
jgi:hypothetical protein